MYSRFLEELSIHQGATSLAYRAQLATDAFLHAAEYDVAIAQYFLTYTDHPATEVSPDTAPWGKALMSAVPLRMALRYGENPHQRAALYANPVSSHAFGLAQALLIQGKPLSYNNWLDADAAWQLTHQWPNHDIAFCAIIKHNTPCGVATAETALAAYERAYAADPTSAFGGVIALNLPLDPTTAKTILSRQFVEVLIVPALLPGVESILADKPACRVLVLPPQLTECVPAPTVRSIDGGILVQDGDTFLQARATWEVMNGTDLPETLWADLQFAWHVVAFVRSNAIVYVRNGQTLGIGGGQTSRVFAAEIAALKAAQQHCDLQSCVMASDAFFPFRDSIDLAAKQGVRAIISPGGSKRDPEVIAAAKEHGIILVFTHERHFRH